MGVAWPAPLLEPPVVSYTTFSPWPRACARGRLFLWPCPRVSPPGYYPAPCPVERGLSSDCPSTSLRTGRDRPADPPATFILAPGPSTVNGRSPAGPRFRPIPFFLLPVHGPALAEGHQAAGHRASPSTGRQGRIPWGTRERASRRESAGGADSVANIPLTIPGYTRSRRPPNMTALSGS